MYISVPFTDLTSNDDAMCCFYKAAGNSFRGVDSFLLTNEEHV